MNPSPHLRCPNCPNKAERYKPPIHGEGPVPCRVMVIGEGPGKTEDEQRGRDGTGHPFIGESGREMRQLYLPLMGLSDENVYITNVIRCLPRDKHGTDNPALAKCCSDYFLWAEIRRVKPRIIITFGAHSGRIIRPGLSLEYDHGRPERIEIMDGYSIIHLPMYHPAAGLRQPEYMQAILDDCTLLRPWMSRLSAGTLVKLEDPFPSPDYAECRTSRDVSDYCSSRCTEPHQPMGIDTEYEDHGYHGKDPICLSFSLAPGTGRVIQCDNKAALWGFQEFVRNHQPRGIFHNWMADVSVLRDHMGIELPEFDDTMMMAYHLGNQPQALKILAHRLCAMQMQEFSDLVDPYWLRAVLDWAERAIPILKPPAAKKGKKDKKTGQETILARMGTNLSRLCSDIINCYGDSIEFDDALLARYAKPNYKAPKEEVDPIKRWKGWEGTEHVIPLIGPMPFKTLRMVPWQDSIYYACRDSDATLRAYHILNRLSRHIFTSRGL